MEVKFLHWLEELSKDHGDLVGKKCANLGELTNGGFRVPPGFALSLDAYHAFLRGTGLATEIRQFFATFEADPTNPREIGKFSEAAAHVQGLMESTEMPTEMEAEVAERYRALCDRVGVGEERSPSDRPGRRVIRDSTTAFSTCGAKRTCCAMWSRCGQARSMPALLRPEPASDWRWTRIPSGYAFSRW